MVAGEGALKWRPEGSLPSHNCSIATGDPPRSIFLGISESYTFYVHFLIDPLQNGMCESKRWTFPVLPVYIVHVAAS